MSAEVVVIIPVLGRPDRAAEVFGSVTEATTDVPHRVVFVCTPGDLAEIGACRATGADVDVVGWKAGPGDWARKINRVYASSEEPWMLLGADDLRFYPDWASEALRVGREAGAGVVGTHDLGNPRVKLGQHSTHPLVSRAYADELGTIDGPGRVLCEEYDHQFSDDELVLTAEHRGRWAFAAGSVVEHLHPYFGKASWDATYHKAIARTAADRNLFMRRRALIEAGAA